MNQDMAFEARYYQDRLHLANPFGDIGVVTLWTPAPTAIKYLERLCVDLNPTTSRIAVIANLYGDGLPQMIRNLLWNPQVSTILIFGQDLSNSATDLINLLTKGVERVNRLGQERFRIIDTERYLDTGFSPDLLTGGYRVDRFGKPSYVETDRGIQSFFATLPPARPVKRERIDAPLVEYKPVYWPSDPRAHTVVRRRPLDAWKEIVFRLMRFGIPSVASGNKNRLELQNLKVVVTEPAPEDDDHLRPYGFSLDDFQKYKDSLMNGELPDGMAYSYGNRLRGYWKGIEGIQIDSLEIAAKKISADPTTRGAYLSLWDPTYDLIAPDSQSTPCLVSLFFRVFQEKLTLTATFRAHNTMSAWLSNFYGLMAIQKFVAKSIPCGAITVISNSISIDPNAMDRLDLAQQIARTKTDDFELDRTTGKRTIREDPNGYFTFTIDRKTKEIVANLKSGGETLASYRGKTAQDIETQIARDDAISLLSHALYVGRQLAIYERELNWRFLSANLTRDFERELK